MVTGLDGLREIADMFREAAKRGESLEPVAEKMHDALLAGHATELARHPIGGPESSGRLERSIISKGDPEHVWETGKDGVSFGTTVPYAMAYEKTKKRTIIDVPPGSALEKKLTDIYAEYIAEAFK